MMSPYPEVLLSVSKLMRAGLAAGNATPMAFIRANRPILQSLAKAALQKGGSSAAQRISGPGQ
jgi:hypothetical protein